MGRVDGKTAIVTGAASGIGRATALLLAREGAWVLGTDRAEGGLSSLASELESCPGGGATAAHDVTSEADWQRVVDQALQARGQLDVLVNNAGIVIDRSFLETSLDEWRRVMAVNLDGTFLGTRFGAEAMGRGGGGSIVNLSSVYGLVGGPGVSAYCASKGGVRLFTKAAALECASAGFGVRVNSVHPGFVETPMITDSLEASPDPAAARRALERLHPQNRLGEPEEVAAAILYLASDESRFVTGSELVIDGGMTAR